MFRRVCVETRAPRRHNPTMRRRLRTGILIPWTTLIGVAVATAQPSGSDPEPASEEKKAEPATLPTPPETRAEPVPGDDVVVVMRNGQRLSGEFVARTPDLVAVKVAGVEARIPASEVERVVAQMPLRERYQQMRSMIDDGDIDRLLLIAEWLRANGLLDEALAEITHILKVAPSNGQALRLRELIDKQVLLRDRQRDLPKAPMRTGIPSEDPDVEGARAAVVWEPPLLTPEQINLIRVYELDLSDPPRIIVPRETVDQLLEEYTGHPMIPTSREGKAEFYKLAPEEILSVMFTVQARDLYGQVQVLANPASMRQFKDSVNRGWLATSCATQACHGGPDAGELALVGRRPSSDEAVYTNFLILERHRLSSGEPLINYEEPEKSPLLQLGLPRSGSAFPHPEVKGWNPTFRNARAKRFEQTVDWIRSMYEPRPEHPIDYPPPEPEGGPTKAPGAPNKGVPR